MRIGPIVALGLAAIVVGGCITFSAQRTPPLLGRYVRVQLAERRR